MKSFVVSLLILFPPLLAAHGKFHKHHHHEPHDAEISPSVPKIAAHLKAIEADPKNAALYPPLAMAYAARARESADGSYYDKGMEAVQKSLALDPKHYPALKAETWILLGRHEFQKALEKSRALVKRFGDDALAHAMLADAAIETGHYDEAEKAAQWALDLDPGGAPGLTRAAYLRELFGDFSGAIELMKQVFNRARRNEPEQRAWLLTHLGHLFLLQGNPEAAEKAHLEALEAYPGYHYALANLAAVKTAQGKDQEAVKYHRQHFEAAPHAESEFHLATALRRAGLNEEADKTFASFEQAAAAEVSSADHSNLVLIDYYIDEGKKPAEALRIAKIEIAKRQDWRTLYAHARALHATGDFKKAQGTIAKALKIGVKYPGILFHAGQIARDAGDEAAARKFFKSSLDQAPISPVSKEAKKVLEKME